MRNKKLKLALSELEKEMEVISHEELPHYKGGKGSGDCKSSAKSLPVEVNKRNYNFIRQ